MVNNDTEKITRFRGEFSFLSNFYQHEIVYNGNTYYNVEAAFQAQKDPEHCFEFCSLSGQSAKALGRRVKLRTDWEEVKLPLMEELIRIKFTDPILREKLLQTGHREIIEGNSWGDDYWGCCTDKGQNHLGIILMKIRKEIREGESK